MSEYRVTEWDGMWCVTGTRQTASGWVQDAWAARARCPTREAAEAARRLLSGECAQGLAEAQIDRMVAAKTGAGKPMRGCNHPEFYANGLADGAAQERARIVAFAKTYVKSPIRADVLAEMIERGEAGE